MKQRLPHTSPLTPTLSHRMGEGEATRRSAQEGTLLRSRGYAVPLTSYDVRHGNRARLRTFSPFRIGKSFEDITFQHVSSKII
jgi:hypothetical protein